MSLEAQLKAKKQRTPVDVAILLAQFEQLTLDQRFKSIQPWGIAKDGARFLVEERTSRSKTAWRIYNVTDFLPFSPFKPNTAFVNVLSAAMGTITVLNTDISTGAGITLTPSKATTITAIATVTSHPSNNNERLDPSIYLSTAAIPVFNVAAPGTDTFLNDNSMSTTVALDDALTVILARTATLVANTQYFLYVTDNITVGTDTLQHVTMYAQQDS